MHPIRPVKTAPIRRTRCSFAAAALLALFLPCAAALAAPGLTVRDGVLLKDGHPYSAVGANYYSLFLRILKDPSDTSSLANLKKLRQAGIPFVRFNCGGFWPNQWRLYRDSPAEYFRRLDLVVKAAEQCDMGLIPSLFWHFPTVADIAGEHMDAYGKPASAANALIRRYTRDVVGRYRNSPAIWGWEFGNEWNLPCDLPNAPTQRPPCVPSAGTPASRSERDQITVAQWQVAMHAFATTARQLDPDRILITGNAIPRPSAWHNLASRSWEADTVEQFAQVIQRDNPDPFPVISIHTYPDKDGYYAARATSIGELLAASARVARAAGKPLFIGEFGVPRRIGVPEQALFDELLAGIRANDIPLAAFWVYDFPAQDNDWNTTLDNDRAWIIRRIATFNQRRQP